MKISGQFLCFFVPFCGRSFFFRVFRVFRVFRGWEWEQFNL